LKPIQIMEQQICLMSSLEEDLFPTKRINHRLHVEHINSPLIENLVSLTYERLNKFLADMK
jgi:hypothetical protein